MGPTRGGLLAQMRARQEYEDERDQPDDIEEPAQNGFKDDGGYMAMQLKRRRYGGIYKKLLTDAGYGDLAKMVNVHRRGDSNVP